MNYKDTLNLPKTDFPMKASLNIREPLILKEWEEKNLYQQIREARKGNPYYILHDGPPYANGHIHMGTALNKILKDFVVKYKTLQNFDVPYIPGWDCHGLPIEHQLMKQMEESARNLDQIQFRKDAKAFAMDWVNTQRNEFKRLGVLGEWDTPYLTLDPDYEICILETLRDIYEKGHMYKSKKPVFWSIGCETALAEAEVEYANHVSPAIFVRFSIVNRPNVFLVIWTTTPWTLPANLAIAVHEAYTYVEIVSENETYIVAKELSNSFIEKCGLKDPEIKNEIQGKDLENTEYKHPFLERISKVILSEYVTLDTGTGLVHIAPGHGQEDYIVGLRYGLDVFSPVDEKGRFTKDAGVCEGMNVFKANPHIIELLKEKEALLHHETISHSYPHCWRSKGPVIFRATEQWFISMDQKGLRKKSLANISDAEWIPDFGESRINSMVSNRPDWCISRQRLWGVPIPGLKCTECGNSFFSVPFVNRLIEAIKKDGLDVWFSKPLEQLSSEAIECPKCRSKMVEKEKDIVDVWFESGVSYKALKKKYPSMPEQADLYLEGSDQHRGWFQSSLMTESALGLSAPFKTVLTHGFVVDMEGKKMSKSLGNVLDPLKMIEKYGADILRLWVAFSDYTLDLKLSEDLFSQISDAYRKIRNTFRFLLGNLYDFNESKLLSYDQLKDLDQWIVVVLNQTLVSMQKDMEEYRFYRAWTKIYNFCNNELSAFYFNIQKDILYCAHSESHIRLSAQSAMFLILQSLVRVLFPFTSFTCEEVWGYWSEKTGKKTSIALESWPGMPEINNKDQIVQKFKEIFQIRAAVYKKIEDLIEEKLLRNSLQAEVKLWVQKDKMSYWSSIQNELKQYFIISQIKILPSENADLKEMVEKIEVSPANGIKCKRCWITFVAENDTEEICDSCKDVVSKL